MRGEEEGLETSYSSTVTFSVTLKRRRRGTISVRDVQTSHTYKQRRLEEGVNDPTRLNARGLGVQLQVRRCPALASNGSGSQARMLRWMGQGTGQCHLSWPRVTRSLECDPLTTALK